MNKKAKRYDKEFKLQAVRLLQESDKSMKQIARDLGVSVNALWLWKKAVKSDRLVVYANCSSYITSKEISFS